MGQQGRKEDVPSDLSELNHEAVLRLQLAELTRSLFFSLDAKIAQMIGFNGSILEEVYAHRPPYGRNEPLQTAGMDEVVQQHVSGSRFWFKTALSGGKYVNYYIECSGHGFHPQLMLPTSDGRLEFSVVTNSEQLRFEQITINRYRHGPDESFIQADKLQTFVSGYSPDKPTNILVLETRLPSQRSVEMRYGTPDAGGNVELFDDQTIHISDCDWLGVYSRRERSIQWNDRWVQKPQLTPSSSLDQNSVSIRIGDEHFMFPIATNLFEEIRQITQGLGTLTRDDPLLPDII